MQAWGIVQDMEKVGDLVSGALRGNEGGTMSRWTFSYLCGF